MARLLDLSNPKTAIIMEKLALGLSILGILYLVFISAFSFYINRDSSREREEMRKV